MQVKADGRIYLEAPAQAEPADSIDLAKLVGCAIRHPAPNPRMPLPAHLRDRERK